MKKWIKILLIAIVTIIAIVIIWEFLYIKSVSTKEVYVFPKGFKGVVLIAYDQKDGREDVKEGGKLIYRIPSSGILKLRKSLRPKLSQSWYYFEDAKGKRTEFYYCFDPKEMIKNPDKIYAFGGSNGTYENDGEKVDITTFIIGTERDRDSLSQIDEKLNPIELLRRK